MPEFHCLKDYRDTDLKRLQTIAEGMDWDQIKYDVKQEQQVRKL